MVYGAINEKGEKFYTYLPKLFDAIDNAQRNYNWLITACDCNVQNQVYDECLKHGYCWISGDALTEIVQKQHIQWIWAVLSGFERIFLWKKCWNIRIPKQMDIRDFGTILYPCSIHWQQ